MKSEPDDSIYALRWLIFKISPKMWQKRFVHKWAFGYFNLRGKVIKARKYFRGNKNPVPVDYRALCIELPENS